MRRKYRRNPGMSSGEIIGLAALGAGFIYLMNQNSLAQATNAATLAEATSTGGQISSALTAGSSLLNSIESM
jgi:hypothetical protein